MEDRLDDGRDRLERTLASRRLVLFDLDDTLCDYTLARSRRLARAFGDAFTVSEQAPPDDLTEVIARSIAMNPHGVDHFPDLLAAYGLTAPAIAAAQEWYRANRFHDLAFFAATTRALAAVRSQPGVAGRRVGIVTNGPAEVQRAKVELLGVAALVHFIVISGEFGVEKPDPAIFREALRLADATADEAVYVGDSAEHDVAGARAAGLAVVWVNRDGGPWTGVGARPDIEVRGIGEIAQAITTGDGPARSTSYGGGPGRGSDYT